jgi:hypothetical protein
MPEPASVSSAERTLTVCRAAARFCMQRGWAPLTEVSLPNGRRADILALMPTGDFVIFEVKSCARDFLSDAKWPEYRQYSDRFYFAVDTDFPQDLLPDETGLLVACGMEAALIRDAPSHRLGPSRRKALLQRFALLAASRLGAIQDPQGASELRAALRVE